MLDTSLLPKLSVASEKSGSGWGVGCKTFLVDGKRDWMKEVKELVVPTFHKDKSLVCQSEEFAWQCNYCTNL